MYTTERVSADITVKDYIEEYVNIEEFLECCKACSNYGRQWSCPPYDFDVLDYWKKFNHLFVFGNKIIFDDTMKNKKYKNSELKKMVYEIITKEKKKMAEELYQMESKYKDSISLSAGGCLLCGDEMKGQSHCSRVTCKSGNAKENCIHFDKMRYSLESLGGNVGKTCSKLLGTELEWVEENKLPSYFVLVCGLLTK